MLISVKKAAAALPFKCDHVIRDSRVQGDVLDAAPETTYCMAVTVNTRAIVAVL